MAEKPLPEYSCETVIDWLEHMSSENVIDLDEDIKGLAAAAAEYLHRLLELDPTVEPPVEVIPPGYLTPHFALSEFTHSDTATAYGIDNTPSEATTDNLRRVAEVLENIRMLCGENPVTITSGYRCPELNKKVGGAENSAHLTGLAADFVIPAFGTPTKICNEILPHLHTLAIDQLINESNSSGDQWVHVGLNLGEPRYQALTIGPGGTQTGIV